MIKMVSDISFLDILAMVIIFAFGYLSRMVWGHKPSER